MEHPDRSNLEGQFASRIAALNSRQSRELADYLNQTDPPSVDNVPPEAWDRWEREHRELLLALILLVFALSYQHHGGEEQDANVIALAWSIKQASTVSSQWAQTGKDMLATTGRDWAAKTDAWKAEVQAAKDASLDELIRTHGELPAARLAPAFEPQALATIEPPITTQEVYDRSAQIFGPSRAENEAITEFTQAQSAGGEAGIEKSVGLSPDDLWVTEHDGDVCPICSKYHKKPRGIWSRLFPDGPPAHPRCRCWIVYANFEAAHGREMPKAA